MNTHSSFLKEMGITEWTSRDASPVDQKVGGISTQVSQVDPVAPSSQALQERASMGLWWFFGAKPQGDAEIFFNNVIRVLGLTPQEWTWKHPAESINPEELPQDGTPIVALAFGGAAAQKLSNERDGLAQLRETVLAIDADGVEEVPLIATFELNHLVSRSIDKGLFWQDLLLAKSVMQNI